MREGSEAAATSLETQLKLTNVARASLGELLEDYIDCLKFDRLERWGAGHSRTPKLRKFAAEHSKWDGWAVFLEGCGKEEFCNAMITVISQTMWMLQQLIDAQQDDFRENGGIRERMTAVRLGRRTAQNGEIASLKEENARLRGEIERLQRRLAALGGE